MPTTADPTTVDTSARQKLRTSQELRVIQLTELATPTTEDEERIVRGVD